MHEPGSHVCRLQCLEVEKPCYTLLYFIRDREKLKYGAVDMEMARSL